MQMRDVENQTGRRTLVAAAWSIRAAVVLSASILPKLKGAGSLPGWIPSIMSSSDGFEVMGIWVIVTMISSGFLAVDFCRWRRRISESTFTLIVMAFVFCCLHAASAYLLLRIIYGSLDNALMS
jgi:hypothetical protein